MADSNALRILYVGRQAAVVNGLQTIFEQPASIFNTNGAAGQPVFEFVAVTSQKAALHLVRSYFPFVILVDMDNRPDGRTRLCEVLHYRLPGAAIVAIGTIETMGAQRDSFVFDDRLATPLIAQQVLETIWRVRSGRTDYRLQQGPLCLNTGTRRVSTPKGDYAMTPKQCALLQMLMLHHGTVVSRKEIMQKIWDTSYLADTRTLDVHVRWLRERIEPDPSSPIYLQTVRGVGYRLWLG